MLAFEKLTKRGKARRLRRLAINALELYNLEAVDVRLAGLYTNALFQVRTVDGQKYILRLCAPGWRTTTDLRSEVMWLQALHHDTDIGAPLPKLARNGEGIIEINSDGVPGPTRCLLMSWLPGTLLEKRLNETNLSQMGMLFARLHEHGANFAPPEGFTERKMDSIFARDEADILFDKSCCDAYTPRTHEILKRTRAHVDEAFARLYADPTDLRVIHNDLHHENIKIDRGRLRPFDFEDTIWGYPVQDIAMALQDLMLAVKPEEFEPFQAAFHKGYESLCPWPESYENQIDIFRAGRMIWVANYVARFERQYLREHLDWLAQKFEMFLETGLIRKSF